MLPSVPMSTLAAVAPLAAALLSASPAAGPTLDEIVARHLQAVGGEARVRAIRSLRHTGVMTLRVGDRTLQGPFVMEMKRPRKARMEADLSGLRMTEVFDGTAGFKILPGSDVPVAMSAEELAKQNVQAEFDPWLLDYKRRGVVAEYLGPAQVGDKPALKLALTLRGRAVHSYLDAATYLEIRRDHLGPDGQPTDEGLVTAFTSTGGLTMPQVLEITSKDKPLRTTIRFQKTEIDPDIPDARFGKP
jgi:hypothetical protein